MRMLNKKKYQLRCNFFIVSITLFIIVFFIKTMCGSYITQWNQNKLFEVINTSTYENLYVDEKMILIVKLQNQFYFMMVPLLREQILMEQNLQKNIMMGNNIVISMILGIWNQKTKLFRKNYRYQQMILRE